MAESFTIDVPVSVRQSSSPQKSWTLDATVAPTFNATPNYNTLPIMGYVLEPTDVEGTLVETQNQLANYYWVLDTSTATPTLYWATQPLSADAPNDQYQPLRLK